MKEKVELLEKLVNGLKDRQPQAGQDFSSPLKDGQESELRDIRQLAAQTGKLNFEESGSTQWIGPSNWESVVEDVRLPV